MSPGKSARKGSPSWSEIQVAFRETVSHLVFLSGNLDDNSNSEAGVINFPTGKTLGGQTAQGLYEITPREEFAKMNELT
jgi:hypothetical protein